MSVYRYNVIIDVDMNTTGATGARPQVKQHLKGIEEDVKRHHERIEAEEAAHVKKMKGVYDELYRSRVRAQKQSDDEEISATAKRNTRNQKAFDDALKAEMGRYATQRKTINDISSKAFADMDNAMKKIAKTTGDQNFVDVDRKVKQITKSTGEGAAAMGMWERAFRGAFVGAVAGIVFSSIIGGIQGIAQATLDAGVQAVRAAGDFEVTTNALKVYTGSIETARSELKAIEELAMNTPGLTLEGSQVGYQRLRALGFQANLAKGFIKELGEEKILSGANDESLERVIFNFAQIASGGQRVSQEMREIVTQMPTMKRAFESAFGSSDPNKIQSFFDEDTAGAFQKLIDAMSKSEAAAGGFNDKLSNLMDAWLLAGRTFGEPILNPAGDALIWLTGLLISNEETWRSWGTNVGSAIDGAMAAARGLGAIGSFLGLDTPNSEASFGRRAMRTGGWLAATGIVGQTFSALSSLGDYMNDREPYKPVAKGTLGIDPGVMKAARQQAMREQISGLKGTFARDRGLVNDSFSVQEKALGLMSKDTIQDERRYQAEYFALKNRQITTQVDLAKKQYDQLTALAQGDAKTLTEITNERVSAISALEKQLAEDRIANAIAVREIEKRENEQRRRDYMQSNELMTREIRQGLDRELFDAERLVETTGDGYADLIRISETGMLAITENHANNLALQLQNERLTQMERANLTRETNLSIEEAQEQHRRRLIEIGDRRLTAMRSNIDRNAQAGVGLNAAQGGFIGTLMDALGSGVFMGAATRGIAGISTATGGGVFGADIASYVGNLDHLNGLSAYEIRRNLMTKAQGQEMEGVRREIQAIDDKRFLGGLNDTDDKALRDQRVLLDLKKSQLEITQGLALENLKLTEHLETINEWTQKVVSGERDRFILENTRTEMAKEYQAVVIAGRQQELMLGDQSLMQRARETNLLREQIALRGEEIDAIMRMDRSQLRVGGKLTYSKNRADAAVWDFLASQKGITDIVSDTKINLLTTAYSGLDAVATRLTRNFGMFRDVVRDLISSLAKLAVNWLVSKMMGGQNAGGGFSMPGMPGMGGGGGGGGSFSIPGMGGGGGWGIPGMGGTAPWNPGANFGTPPPLGPITLPSGRVIDPNFSTGGLGDGMLGPAGASMAGGGGLRAAFSGLAPALPFMGAGLGAQLGGSSRLGMGLGMLGGLALGGAGAVGLLGGSGAAIFASGGSLSALGGVAAFLTNPFTIAGAGVLLLGAYLLGRNKRRREEEKVRNQAMLDAFAAMDQLIKDVENDRIDGTSAIASADAIRKNYLDQMGQLKDKKTREIALRDVSRIDSKIATLKDAVSKQMSRRERLELMAPTFAYGGHVTPGYQRGPGSNMSDSMFGYFPQSQTYAHYSNGEYVLDAETTSNIGTHNLDTLRATKGASYGEMRQNMPVTSSRGGGVITPSMGGGGGGPMQLELSLNVGLAADPFVQVISAAMRKNNGSSEQVAALVNLLQTDGGEALVYQLKKLLLGDR